MKPKPLSRRRFLQHVGLAGAVLALPAVLRAAAGRGPRRIALAGNSSWGRAVVSALQTRGATLASVCEVMEARRALPAGAPLGPVPPAASASWEAALRQSGADCAVIATPDHARAGAVRAALRHGCDVIVRGPGATSVREWLELEQLARATGRALAVPAGHRGDESLQALQRLLATGQLGALRSVELDVWEPKVRGVSHPAPGTLREVAAWCGDAPLWPEARLADFGKVQTHWREIVGYGQGSMSGAAWDALDLVHWMSGVDRFEVEEAMGGTHRPLGFLPRSLRTAMDHQVVFLRTPAGLPVSCQFRRTPDAPAGANRCVVVTARERITLHRLDGRWQYRGNLPLASGVREEQPAAIGTAASATLLGEFAAIDAAS
jgi:predicted dehydrogenase